MQPNALERARQVANVIAGESEAIHRGGRLTERALAALIDADLFRASAPAELGGSECDVRMCAAIAEALGRADVSTGWCFVQANASSYNFGPRLDPGTAAEIFAGPGSVVAAGFPVGVPRADAVEGGYVVSGAWMFASGCLHASWFDARAMLHVNGERVTERDGLFAMSSLLVPRDAVTVSDAWDVTGMRGTGSHHYSVTDTFVPSRRSVSMRGTAPKTAPVAFQVPALTYAHVAFASLALGGAAAALDDFRDLVMGKTAALTRTSMRETATAQRVLAEAHSALRAASAYQSWVIDLLVDAAAGPAGVTHEHRAEARLAVTSGMQTALDVVDKLYRVSGTTGIFVSSSLHRRFQDLHVMGQQLFARPSHFENVGRYMLGLEFDRSLL
jgi:alkylation response protein AidB-like acyl-CoA dehydrogenase